MKKLVGAVAVSLVMSMVLVIACGSETTEPPPTPDPTPTPPEPTKQPEPTPPEPTPPEPTKQPEPVACGEEGQPPCPLQGWMEQNVQPAVENRDAAALGAALEKIAQLAPDPSWNEGENSWSQIALDHAAKAKAGDFQGARASCKGCHKIWRERYREEHRTRPLPAGF